MPAPVTDSRILTIDTPLTLDSGATLARYPLAYEAYGSLSPQADNAVLVFHALTGDQHVASTHPITGRAGWWDRMVGRGKPIDTDRYFVLCANVIGSCLGSAGPNQIDPVSGQRWGLTFPRITLADMVRAQQPLFDRLGIARFHAAIGGSMGGMQALQFARDRPDRVDTVIALAAPFRHSAQNIALHHIARAAILADPAWADGAYYDRGTGPKTGLSLARMATHLTYTGPERLEARFGRNRQRPAPPSPQGFGIDYQVESYLSYKGTGFTDRFDANSFLYISRAMDDFDLGPDEELGALFGPRPPRFFLASFTSDWLYPTAVIEQGARAMAAAGVDVRFVEFETDFAHDAFLLDLPALDAFVAEALAGR